MQLCMSRELCIALCEQGHLCVYVLSMNVNHFHFHQVLVWDTYVYCMCLYFPDSRVISGFKKEISGSANFCVVLTEIGD